MGHVTNRPRHRQRVTIAIALLESQRGAMANQATGSQHGDIISKSIRLVHEVGAVQQRTPLRRPPQQVLQLLAGHSIHPAAAFVDDHHGGAPHQSQSHLQLALHAARQRRRGGRQLLGQPHLVGGCLRRGSASRNASNSSHELQVLPHCQPRELNIMLRAEANTGMLCSTRLVYYRVPRQQRVASRGLHHASEDADEGALAGTIVAQQRCDGSGMHVQVHPSQSLCVAVGLGQPPDGHHRRRSRSGLSSFLVAPIFVSISADLSLARGRPRICEDGGVSCSTAGKHAGCSLVQPLLRWQHACQPIGRPKGEAPMQTWTIAPG
mmetsp:Transcript_7891/g.23249  ORF Transcript_7891/g.23249 Transcript_7891/m.23249 type:complete len:322 (-) Transcript_7891:2773-3738(-)